MESLIRSVETNDTGSVLPIPQRCRRERGAMAIDKQNGRAIDVPRINGVSMRGAGRHFSVNRIDARRIQIESLVAVAIFIAGIVLVRSPCRE